MRRIDHIVIAVRDLDKAADAYRRIGFQVGARNRHPWGTENRLIQFGSSFIELITIGESADLAPHRPRQFSFGAFVRDYLNKREGIAMLALSSADAISDAALFADRGIGDFEPFSFSRTGVRPDGSETKVAFTLAFAHDSDAPDLSFFVCQQHYPQNFWNRDFQRHPNGATNIATVTLTAAAPEHHKRFLTAFTGIVPQLSERAIKFALAAGCIEVQPAKAHNPLQASPVFTSFAVQVEDVGAVRRLLARQGIPFTGSDEDVAVAAPASSHAVELRFEPAHRT
ncbi:MAG: VOC family protein [Acidobacteriota bacterium]